MGRTKKTRKAGKANLKAGAFNWFLAAAFATAFGGCATKPMDYEKTADVHIKEEYEQKIHVKEIQAGEASAPAEGTGTVTTDKAAAGVPPEKAASEKAKKNGKGKKSASPEKHLPDIEDGEGFTGRRPAVDPFRVGEKVTLAMTYFAMTAGYIDLEVLPFVEVNGKKAYSFRVNLKTNSFFSKIYTVDDQAQTYLDYESMLPFDFRLNIRESKQVADIRSVFDWKNLKGHYWAKRVHKDKGERNKEVEWDIKSFSQNVISAIFYLRAFTLTPGKKLAFRVADEGKNIVFTGDVLGREVLDTDIGKIKTVKIKPTITVEGNLKPVGDIFLWLTDDDRKHLVRIESKIKIGTLVGKIKAIEPGMP
jgi:hypothetical protein